MITGAVPPPPVANLIGFRITEVELGRAVFELDASHRHANPMGTLHGGILCDVADAAIGCAFASTLEADETFTSLDLTIKFFKPIWSAKLKAVATVTKRTRTIGLLECEVTDEGGGLVAKLFSTCTVLRGEDAKGRAVGDAHKGHEGPRLDAIGLVEQQHARVQKLLQAFAGTHDEQSRKKTFKTSRMSCPCTSSLKSGSSTRRCARGRWSAVSPRVTTTTPT